MAYLEHTSAIVKTIAPWPIVGGSDGVELRWRGVLPDIGPGHGHLGSCIGVLASLTRSCDLLLGQRRFDEFSQLNVYVIMQFVLAKKPVNNA